MMIRYILFLTNGLNDVGPARQQVRDDGVRALQRRVRDLAPATTGMLFTSIYFL